MPAEIDFAGNARERRALDQICTHQGQFVFACTREFPEQPISHQQAKRGIAEEFQSFVVIIAVTAMGQRALEQRTIREAIVQLPFDRRKFLIRAVQAHSSIRRADASQVIEGPIERHHHRYVVEQRFTHLVVQQQ